VGPGQRADFAVASFARQLARIVAGQAEPVLRVGNLEAQRDFNDVRDVVVAYRLALAKMPSGAVFNVCSGRARRIDDVLRDLIEVAGIEVEILVDPERLRSHDIPLILGSAARLEQATGWRPAIDWRATLTEIYQNSNLQGLKA
jgi:GDP-4-dehydro-6-deoxy-D-mannose reductase